MKNNEADDEHRQRLLALLDTRGLFRYRIEEEPTTTTPTVLVKGPPARVCLQYDSLGLRSARRFWTGDEICEYATLKNTGVDVSEPSPPGDSTYDLGIEGRVYRPVALTGRGLLGNDMGVVVSPTDGFADYSAYDAPGAHNAEICVQELYVEAGENMARATLRAVGDIAVGDFVSVRYGREYWREFNVDVLARALREHGLDRCRSTGLIDAAHARSVCVDEAVRRASPGGGAALAVGVTRRGELYVRALVGIRHGAVITRFEGPLADPSAQRVSTARSLHVPMSDGSTFKVCDGRPIEEEMLSRIPRGASAPLSSDLAGRVGAIVRSSVYTGRLSNNAKLDFDGTRFDQARASIPLRATRDIRPGEEIRWLYAAPVRIFVFDMRLFPQQVVG